MIEKNIKINHSQKLKNLNHWFPEKNIKSLNALYFYILELKASKKIKDFSIGLLYMFYLEKAPILMNNLQNHIYQLNIKKEPKRNSTTI